MTVSSQQVQAPVGVNLPSTKISSSVWCSCLCDGLGLFGWAVTTNKVTQPWSDLETKIEASGGCSESSRRNSWAQDANRAISSVATAWTTGLGVWSDGGHAVCLLRGTSVHSLPCCDDAGRPLTYRASSISLVQKKKDVWSSGGREDRSCWRWANK